MARFRIPAGARLQLKGRFPHTRYISYNSYNASGIPIDALADTEIRPDAGSTNPFVAGNRRDLPMRRRAYEFQVVAADPPADGGHRNALCAGAQAGEIQMYYRAYVPDRRRDLAGDGGLATPVLTLADGMVVRGGGACAAVNTPDRSFPVLSITADAWRAFRATPGCDSATFPAFNPFHWERFFNFPAATQGLALECRPGGHEQRQQTPVQDVGGAYSNKHIPYLFAFMHRRFGRLLVLRGRAPTFPQTYEGQRRMRRGQVRYWSFCTYESRVTTRVGDCVADYAVPLTARRRYTIVVSRRVDRPRDARKHCGVAWLNYPPNGDGAGDRSLAQVILRQMLPAASRVRSKALTK